MLHIVIPAYNEQDRLPRTLRSLRRHVANHRQALGRVVVTVVDNASDDGTAEVARAADSPALPVRVLSCEIRGKGAAVRAGLLATAPEETVCFMDADGATGFEALETALARIEAGADVVIGSRALASSVTEARHTRTRSAGAACYRAGAARMLPDLTDTQCGFKMFRGTLVRPAVAELRASGFAFDVELLVRLRAAGAVIEEIPVVWADVPGSTFVPMRDGASSFLELAGIAWRTRGLGAARPARATQAPQATPAGARSVPMPVAVPAALAAVLVPLAVPMHVRAPQEN
ncbi:glycosyltransferase [Nocardioides sp. YIM 152588]|uniref:glycosyltransferase n=1 Tax=Nocardioides sp. YIM 152588 TaxID=3158259 RepID=UPI0032E52C67